MVIANIKIEDKANRSKFLQKTLLIVDSKFEVVLKMPFLKISNIDVLFCEKTLT